VSAPKVSVVIPAYNAAKFIDKTLDSVRAQTFTDYEIIVTDDGSKDETQSVVEAYLKKHALAGRCLRQENKGIAAARNTGIKAAQGALVALVDHDDFWAPEKLAKSLAAFAAHPEAVLVGHRMTVTRDGRALWVASRGPCRLAPYDYLLLVGNAVSPSSVVFLREKALSIGGFRENPEFNTVEDYDFWMRFAKVGPFYFIDEVLGEVPLNENTASTRVEYHHTNTLALLRDHFAARFGARPGLVARVAMRRRMAAVYRSAAGKLIAGRASRDKQAEYIGRMMREFPLDPKNVARAVWWVITGCGRTQ
jgi:glycosyltransferase involved in cell wall biosynthesis